MKILWICNLRIPCIAEHLGIKISPFGGWLDALSRKILTDHEHSLFVLYPENSVESGSFDLLEFQSFSEDNCAQIVQHTISNWKPDAVHIWGTEFIHSNIAAKVCKELKLLNSTVISIQGLTSICSTHYYSGMSANIINKFSVRDFIKHDNIRLAAEKFSKKGRKERETLCIAQNVIGRTDWDRAAVHSINPNINYFFCNETLRECFYNNYWSIANIQKHSIFISQCSYPIKGFHFALQALPFLLKDYPDTHIYTAGSDLLNLNFDKRIRMTAYQKYLIKLIRDNHLEKHVSFLGTLDEWQMCKMYLSANVFASCSTIENSSNSICEAMLVGCPVVSSFVGGAQTLITHGEDGYLYQQDAPYMLAYYIGKLFSDTDTAQRFSELSRQRAAIRHNRESIYNTLINTYKDILSKQ